MKKYDREQAFVIREMHNAKDHFAKIINASNITLQLYRSIKPFRFLFFFFFFFFRFGTGESYTCNDRSNEISFFNKLNNVVSRTTTQRARRGTLYKNVTYNYSRYKHIYIGQSNKYLSFLVFRFLFLSVSLCTCSTTLKIRVYRAKN